MANKETRVTRQSGMQVQMPPVGKPVMKSVRASVAGKPYRGAPGHSMPR